MRKIFTLLMGLVLLCPQTKGQYSEDFETAGVLGANCLDHNQFNSTIGSGMQVIHGLGSAYTNPPTSSSETRSLTTPFLTITSDPLTISFYYQVSNKLNGNATRAIELGLVDRYGTFTSLDVIKLDKFSPTSAQLYNRTFTGLAPGVMRVSFRITGNTGDGNSRILYDDLYVSASPYYGPVAHCNGAPQAINDNYYSPGLVPVSGNVVTGGAGVDSDPDGEALTATLATPPADSLGTLTFNPDGSFTFTPAPTFTGGLVTFTYRVTDEGYPATTSGLATVTISYLISTLPVQLTGFSGLLVNGRAELSWSVASNETASRFVVERSADGRHFAVAGRLNASARSGRESYRFTDVVPLQGKRIYRLRLTDRQGREEYSRAIQLQEDDAQAPALTVQQNPSTPALGITYKSPGASTVLIRVYNMAGQRVWARTQAVQQGVNQLSVDGYGLAGGNIYILEVIGSTGERSRVKFRK